MSDDADELEIDLRRAIKEIANLQKERGTTTVGWNYRKNRTTYRVTLEVKVDEER
jgi:hypothetical protein